MKHKISPARLIAAALLLGAQAALFPLNLPKSVGAALPKPSAEVTSFQLEAISLRDVSFRFVLAVKNPYPVALKFDGMTLDFSVEGAKVFTVASQGGFSVGAKSERSNAFTVALSYESVIKLVKDYVQKDWLNTVIDGSLVIPIPKIDSMPGLPPNVSFSYRFQKRIPAIKPQVAILDFSVKPPTEAQIAEAIAKAGRKVDKGKALGVFKNVLAGKKPAEPVIDPAELDVPLVVSFTIAIRNEAKGPISFDRLGYELAVNQERLVAGESAKVVRDGDRTLITVDNSFSSRQLSKGIKAVFADRKGAFSVKGSASIKLP
ncbi:MAG TPA: LEA type 2 family protein, partial [Rectinemataceae bacterium]|nr:LEA type 2 family protein [Rectinemataceae bacterium]